MQKIQIHLDKNKEEIDKKIGRKNIMSKNVNKKMGIYILTGIFLFVSILATIVIATEKKVRQSGGVSYPTFTDEDGKVYVVAFLKEMTENNMIVDVIEFITDDNEEEIRELNLTEDDMPDGYYIYNTDTETIAWKLDAQTVYIFIDWNGEFSDSEYPEKYTTTDVQEFKKYIETYENATPGMPFFFQIEDDVVRLVLEKPFA